MQTIDAIMVKSAVQGAAAVNVPASAGFVPADEALIGVSIANTPY